MTGRQIKALGIVLFALLATLIAINLADREGGSTAGGLLLPELKSRINDINELTVTRGGESVSIRNESGKWFVVERDGYPADTGKLRALLLALADASRLEEKTSDPEQYERLGVDDSSKDSKGTEVRIKTPSSESAVIVGNLAQRKYRYARVPGESKSWLINQNPTVPGDTGGWLAPEIVDIDSERMRSVVVTHADGETVQIENKEGDPGNFEAVGTPKGRELRYPTIVNGMASVLSKLNLQDVRKAAAAGDDDTAVATVFTTVDGLELTVRSVVRDDDTWIRLSAAALPDASAEGSEPETAGDPDTETQAAGQAATDGDAEPGSDTDTDRETAQERADRINQRVAGWEYRIQSYKGDQLRRRWADLLQEEGEQE